MTEKPEFQLGLVMAGAISAGAYSAGVMDFLFEALDSYYAARKEPGWSGPTHDVRIPVMTGASAGGMTAAIAALHAFHDITPVRPIISPPAKPANRLYSSWVTDISIEQLLETSDLKDAKTFVRSALCSGVLLKIVNDAFAMQGRARLRDWIGRGEDRSLRVMFTLTNIRGVPYSFRIFGASAGTLYGMLNHADYLDFSIGMPGPVVPGSHALDIQNTSSPDWDLYKTAALATGAFPIGLAPRLIDRPPQDYNQSQLVGYEDQFGSVFNTIGPDQGIAALPSYSFVAVDGGTIDNEPLELARRYIANRGHNDQNGQTASKAVLLAAPFPNLVRVPDKDDRDYLIHVIPKLFSTLIEQARFKPDEFAKAADDTIFSRFMISPVRPANNNPEAIKYPIASGTLNGFGGLLHESFRRHDYLLGRRNAQAFLRWHFALPETNPLFDQYRNSLQWEARERWLVRDVKSNERSILRATETKYERKKFAREVKGTEDTFGLPIIPLTSSAVEPIEIGTADLPKPEAVLLENLSTLIRKRAELVVERLVDFDLLQLTGNKPWSLVLRWAVRNYATDLASRRANTIVESAVRSVANSFR
jgi:hypothetical protein